MKTGGTNNYTATFVGGGSSSKMKVENGVH
jgi:hypothetical protein